MPRRDGTFNLFVYGTLMSPDVFRSVLGRRLVSQPDEADGVETFLARPAVLAGYKKISPDQTYLYAVPDPQGRITGYLIGPLPNKCLSDLRRYEGRNYKQVRVKVLTAEGEVPAIAFVGKIEQIHHPFGWEFRDHLKQEVLLREKIEEALLEDEANRFNTDEQLTRLALKEMHALTIRDLVRYHFDTSGISNYTIHQAIKAEPIREFGEILTDPQVSKYVPHYLTLVIRQVIFNQIEERIHDELRYELDEMGVSDKFYLRTISSLIALRMLNAQKELLHILTGDALNDLSIRTNRLIDYVRYAVELSQCIYDPARANQELNYIRDHMHTGWIPIGIELEFSNTGHGVILDPKGEKFHDEQYDGFYYFRDFALDILMWKLGGHVDDHHVKFSTNRRRGFLEIAFGVLSVKEDISKPVSNDPWVINQLIHALIDFYPVKPHSLHVSLQLRSPNRPVRDRPLPLSVMKCLFALVGAPSLREDGAVEISRLVGNEIICAKRGMHMLFADTSRRRSKTEQGPPLATTTGRGKWVQQFKFLRLSRNINYEPIIAALKGLQIHFKPGSFLTASQYESNPRLREIFEELIRWGKSPTPLGNDEINLFLTSVHDGLMSEYRGQPAHTHAYINYCMALLELSLNHFNNIIRAANRSDNSATHH